MNRNSATFISHSSIPKEHRPSSGIRGLNILIVDDNAGDAHLLKFWLERFGCKVQYAKDGGEALTIYKRNAFNFILMDLDMPCLDGYEATKAIRSSESELATQRSAIIAISGLEDKQISSECQKNDMDGYFAKPVCPRELAFALAEITDRSPGKISGSSANNATHLFRNQK